MKRIFLLLTFAASTIAGASAQRHFVRLTRYEGRPITGVSASSGFDVHLVRSTETKVVAEVSEVLEPYLVLSLGADGIVRAGLDMGSGVQSIRTASNSVLKLTVYLPTLTELHGSGGTDFYSADTFQARRVKIAVSGGADLESLRLETGALEVRASGRADVSLSGRADELKLSVSGGADAELDVSTVTAAVNVSGAADAELRGGAEQAVYTVSGGAELQAENFAAKRLTVTASGAGGVTVWAVDELKATASGAGHIRYRGRPAQLDNRSSSAGSVRRMD